MAVPSLPCAQSGSVLHATASFSRSVAVNAAKQSFVNNSKSENICPTFHSSPLNEIFFETVEHMDCYIDPMSIYR